MRDEKKIGVGESASVSKTLTETDVYSFAGICGDFNPVHIDKQKAEKTIFGRRICHGMLTASFISTVLGMYLPGPNSIYLEQSLKFVAPVYIGDTITASVTVLEVKDKIVKLETIVKNQNGERVVEGIASVMI